MTARTDRLQELHRQQAEQIERLKAANDYLNDLLRRATAAMKGHHTACSICGTLYDELRAAGYGS